MLLLIADAGWLVHASRLHCAHAVAWPPHPPAPVHILCTLLPAALLPPRGPALQMWADWAGGSTDRRQQQLRLLYGRTCSLLGSHWPQASMPSPDDVASRASASACFLRLLEAPPTADSTSGSTSSGGESGQRLGLLGQLLSSVWRDGMVWEAAAADGSEGKPPPAGVSCMHGSWLALMVRMAEVGSVLQALRCVVGGVGQVAGAKGWLGRGCGPTA